MRFFDRMQSRLPVRWPERLTRVAWAFLIGGLFVVPLLLTSSAEPALSWVPASGSHRHWTSVKHTIQEQFGVTATETFVEGTMIQTSAPDVTSQSLSAHYCYNSSFPTWTNHGCTPAVTKFPSRDGRGTRIKSEIWGDYSHSTGADYVMHSWYNKFANEGDTFQCQLDRGALPWAWDNRCKAYHDGRLVGSF